ncbi:MAG: H-NS histone family protein [Nitrococcus mobilis]|nr:H-NS histone family protein [Nitrococcus mobilis]
MMDLSKYTIKDLERLKKDIDKEIASRRKHEERQAREEIKEVAAKYGFTLNELVGGISIPKGRSQSKAQGKFQHPEDPTKTWTGRGRKPNWVKEWEAAGCSIDDLRAA